MHRAIAVLDATVGFVFSLDEKLNVQQIFTFGVEIPTPANAILTEPPIKQVLASREPMSRHRLQVSRRGRQRPAHRADDRRRRPSSASSASAGKKSAARRAAASSRTICASSRRSRPSAARPSTTPATSTGSIRAARDARGREPQPQAAHAARLHRPPDGRRLAEDAAGHRPRGARGRLAGQRPHSRRVGHRQGDGGAPDPRQLAAQGRPVRGHQLRGAARDAARVGALRHRARRGHRRRGASRQVRAGQGRHGLPRRDRRHPADAAGQAAARAAGARDREARRPAPHPDRRPHPRPPRIATSSR